MPGQPKRVIYLALANQLGYHAGDNENEDNAYRPKRVIYLALVIQFGYHAGDNESEDNAWSSQGSCSMNRLGNSRIWFDVI